MALNKIKLSKSCIGDAEVKSVLNVLDKSYFGMGQEVKKFETVHSTILNRTPERRISAYQPSYNVFYYKVLLDASSISRCRNI